MSRPDRRRRHRLTRGVGLLLAVLLAAGILVPSAAAPAVASADPVVGVNVHAAWSDLSSDDRVRLLDRLVEAGVGSVRIDLAWPMLEPDAPGRIDGWWEDRIDGILGDASHRGLEVLVVMWRTPTWASGSDDVRVPPRDPAQFGRFLGWFAERYDDRLDAVQVWNEPNLDGFWRGDVDQYAALLREAARGVRASGADVRVVLGGPSYNDTGWLDELYEAGAAGDFDVLATHPYQGQSDLPPETRSDDEDIHLLTNVERVAALMDRYGDTDVPIWFTEFGWHLQPADPQNPPWEQGVTPEQQGEYLVRTIDLVAERYPRVEQIYWYNAREREGAGPRDDTYGLLRRDLTPKPAYWALLRRLGGRAAPPTPEASNDDTRIEGGDRVDTAVTASRHGWPAGSDEVLLARSDLPSDAVVAGPLAARLGAPVLLTARDGLDPRTAAEIVRLGVRRVTAVGGPDALAARVLDDVRALGSDVRRLAGGDRAATAAAVAAEVPGRDAIVVDGWPTSSDPVWADALVAGGLAVATPTPRPVLLGADPLPADTAATLAQRGGSVTVVGTGPTAALDALRDHDRVVAVIGDDAVGTSLAALRATPHTGAGPYLLATARAFPDGLVGTALAHRLAARLVLVDPDDGTVVTDLVTDRSWLVIGGTHALPDAAVSR